MAALDGIPGSQVRVQSSILNALDARTRDEFGNPCDEHYWSCMWHYRQHCSEERQRECGQASGGGPQTKKKAKYTIKITEMKYPIWLEKGYTIDLNLSKEYGNCHGSFGGVKTEEEAIERVRDLIKQWEDYDGILSRISDKVTVKNTDFKSDFDDITLPFILKGQKSVEDFFSPSF